MNIGTKEEIEILIELLRYLKFPEEDIFNLEVVLEQSDWESEGTPQRMDAVQPGYETAYGRGVIFLDRLYRVFNS